MTTQRRPFTTVASRIAWSCPWYRVRQDKIRLTDGTPGVYNVIEKPDAVWVLGLTADGRVPMLYQYRYTVDDWCWEIPAGSVKPGQTPEEAAREELLEEVGGTAGQLTYVGRSYLANGICNEVGHIFWAEAVSLGTPAHEAAEVIEVHLLAASEVLRMARAGEISDGPSALAVLMCADRLSVR